MPDHHVVAGPAGSAGPLAGALLELAGLLLATESFQELMQRIAELAVKTVPPALTCGITLSHAGRVITVASANPLGALLDEQQYSLEEGPCLEAMNTGQIVNVPDLARETRWNGYPQRAMAHGVSAVYSSPLIIRGETHGVLNLYAAEPHLYDSPDLQMAVAQIVTLTGVAVTATLRNYGDISLTNQLQTALNSRSVIDQAVGIVIGAQHCTPEQAFTILRGVSQTRNVRLALIAEDLVSRSAKPSVSGPKSTN